MRLKPFLLLLLHIAFGMFVGCSSPPAPPSEINTRLKDFNPYIDTKPDKAKAETIVIAKCREFYEYAVTKKNKNWRYHWYYTEWDVINVEKGKWSEPMIKFVFGDLWPTPESGILLSKMIFMGGLRGQYQ